MIRLITYSDQTMTISRERCIKSFTQQAMKSQIIYEGVNAQEWDREMIGATEFYQLNREILDAERGSGFWAWKPYIIYKALLDMNENDILIYSDAGVEFINDVSHIINVMDEDVFLFGNNWNHVDWCKYCVAMEINYQWLYDAGGYSREYGYSQLKQVQASVIFIRPTQKAKEFVKQWLLFCQMPKFITDEKMNLAELLKGESYVDNYEYETFRDHRHDQAILTCLAIKYGIRLHWWPASYSNGAFIYDKIEQYKNDNYPVIFNHHRKRNNEY